MINEAQYYVLPLCACMMLLMRWWMLFWRILSQTWTKIPTLPQITVVCIFCFHFQAFHTYVNNNKMQFHYFLKTENKPDVKQTYFDVFKLRTHTQHLVQLLQPLHHQSFIQQVAARLSCCNLNRKDSKLTVWITGKVIGSGYLKLYCSLSWSCLQF